MDDNKVKLYSFVNPYSYYIIKGSEFENEFTYFADGILLVVLNNFFAKVKIKRFSFDFTSLAGVVCQYAVDNSLSVSLVGGTKEEVELARNVLYSKFPNLNIVFCHHGFISQDKTKVIGMLSEVAPDILICGMGTPMQEEFLLNCRGLVPSLKLGFTCGGFLSQIASNVNYFHPTLNKLNLRWLQRFLRHGYVRKRLLIDYPIFFCKFITDKLKGSR
ncbi:MAG: WecB/TagA/CpsF family glycosyltransferase [Shewanella sp.]|uniref:WecB/TagA/CpsF family glycosyltransferase n=1 Tax=Shewanella sp. TaxID=50422 RepID=UPI00264A0A36|nr:WecB/TagA/CpsF family glycosyltransferase [Shewanella sp.]MDN5501811.1 WecB/TagA/CpsF family glycosyltransferase [Shewanella sp.]MDN5529710.1 WecB/TagA/CpsF family glycosyltransferase [Shewanella sp.]